MNMNKKRVSVQIEGRNYVLITTEDAKYVNGVAAEVIEHIRRTAQTSKHLDTRDCAVLAALDFCDDRNKSVKKNKDFVDKADKIIKQTNELNKTCTEYKEKLTEAINENTRLTKRVRTLEKQLAELVDENNRLNSLLPKLEENEEDKKPKDFSPAEQYSLFGKEEENAQAEESGQENADKADFKNRKNISAEKNFSKSNALNGKNHNEMRKKNNA